MVRYSTALSHIILAGTGLYCLKALSRYENPFSKVPFGLVIFHSLLGIWRWGNPQYGLKIDKYYKITETFKDFLLIPSINATIWLKYNNYLSFMCSHILLSLVPIVIYLYDSRKQEVVNAFHLGNAFSLIFVSYWNENFFGISTSISYVLSYFVIKQDMLSGFSCEVPTQDLLNYSMCFFVFFAVRSLVDPVY
ncbi:uncharacterized protein [Euwallacea fornicatus]|uniref:uncharacterized protein n=1 Tax=Euwallacea fornicatus TaxID=995702 RepID=UPI00338E159F